MKTLNITYDAMTIENGKKIYGETCMDIPMMDDVADRLISHGSSGCAVARIECILQSVELLRGRHYIKGSIKDYREA
ncbi:MAG TPA: hypothetical protein DEP23_16300 [Ruminococcaceae bacterium]|jgi:hypothetical protein|nr:hypothetical protein [Oscillospiraceae bacterium]